MTVVRKTFNALGTFQTPDGPIEITPSRVQHWARQFQKLTSAGVKIPVPFGHQLAARPANADDTAYLRSKYNAGYLKSLKAIPNGVEFSFDLPGLKADSAGNLIDPSTGAAISEISPAIGDWRDGQGNLHQDIVNHVALVTLPVVAGQDGFQSLATNQPPLVCLSTDGKGFRMATEKEKADKAFDKVSDKAKADATDSGDDSKDNQSSTDDGMLSPATAEDPLDPGAQDLQEVKALLGEMGAQLPEDTDQEKFLEHLRVALTAIKARLIREKQTEKEAEPVAPEKLPEQTMQPAPTMPNMMMGTLTAREQKLAAKLNTSKHADRLAKIEALRKRGLKADVVDELTAQTSLVRLSLTEDGDIAEDEFDRQLKLLDKSLPKTNPFTARMATPPGGPGDKGKKVRIGNDEGTQEQLDTIEEMLRLGRGRVA